MNIPGHNVIRDQKTLLKAFISTFTSEDFMIDLVRIILHPSEFGAFTSERSNSAIDYIRDFLKGLGDTARRLQLPTAKNIQSQIQVINTLLTIRESSSSLLTYENVFQHMATRDLVTTKLIQKAVEGKLTEDEQFRKITDNVIDIIHAYHEVISVSSTITLLDNLQESISDNNLTPFEALKNYKDLVIAAYNDLSKLQSLSKAESIADYFIITDEKSCSTLADTLVSYIAKGFSVFKTGFELFDSILEGVESSSVHLLAAPSNHGKSLLCVNLCKRMIEANISDLDKKDAIVFLTLEDDVHKLARRFISIFGNYKFEVIKQLFAKAYEVTRSQQIMGMSMDSNDHLIGSLQKMFKNLLKSSLLKITQGKCSLVIKHCNENTFSPGDLGKFIDRLKVEGYRTKLVFVDYMDVMTPTTSVFGNMKEYDTQGAIVQELRNLSRIHGVPVISPTQNQRDSEDVTKFQSNRLIGDSYKKIRYSDFIYMMRMREDKNFLSEGVREQVVAKKTADGIPQDSVSPEVLAIKDRLSDVLVPLEIKITKSKDSEKNKSRFLLFCKENLRIYNNIDEYIKDAPTLKVNSSKLEKDIDLLINQAITSVVATDFVEISPVTTGLVEIIQKDQTEVFQTDDASHLFH